MPKDRQLLLARLTAERGALLYQLLGLDRRALTEEQFLDGWTVKDCLVHIAAWDSWEHRQMERMLSGEPPADVGVDIFNAAVVADGRGQSLDQVVAEMGSARAAWLTWLHRLPEAAFFISRHFDDQDWVFAECLEVQWRHDAEHSAQIAAWREDQGREGGVGPQCVLMGALDAAREELLAASDLVPEEKRASYIVCGVWTLKDVLGHLADWEELGADRLRARIEGRVPEADSVADIEAWNRAHVAARRGQPWEQVWDDLHATRESFVAVVSRMEQADLQQPVAFPWGGAGTTYAWVSAFVRHDRDHAAGIREMV